MQVGAAHLHYYPQSEERDVICDMKKPREISNFEYPLIENIHFEKTLTVQDIRIWNTNFSLLQIITNSQIGCLRHPRQTDRLLNKLTDLFGHFLTNRQTDRHL